MARPIRTLHVVGSLSDRFGGPSRSVPALAAALSRHDVDNRVVAQRTGDSDAVFDRFVAAKLTLLGGIHSDRLRIYLPFNASARIAAIGAHDHANLIHDHGVWLPINNAACYAAMRLGIPYVISPRGMLNTWPLQHKQLKKRIALWLYQQRNLSAAHLYVATSSLEARDIRMAGLTQPIAIVPNGVETPPAIARPPRPANLDRIALFLSRIHPKKGLRILVRTWARVRPRGWRVVIAGPNEEGHREEIERLASDLGVADRFEFFGPVEGEAKENLFAQSALFLLPSHSENFGIAVAEAMAHGLPVVTTRATPWAELNERRCGWWVGDNEDELEKALVEACRTSEEHLRAMGERGRQLVEEKYSWSGAARQMRECYAWLLKDGPKPSCLVDY